MMKPSRMIQKRRKTTGQAIVLVALAFIGLALFLGMVVDLGQIFIAQAYLRRATDAASLAAASQFRAGRSLSELEAAASQTAEMNNIQPDTVTVETCGTNPGDSVLCVQDQGMPKKLVRVSIKLTYPLTFMTLAHIYNVPLTDESVSEAASMDVVIILDTSESMAWGDYVTDHSALPQDPSLCNADLQVTGGLTTNGCKPFKYVQSAAEYLTSKILDLPSAQEEDRMALVQFSSNWEGKTKLISLGANGWTTDKTIMDNAIGALQVYDPGLDCDPGWDTWDAEKVSNPDGIPLGMCKNYSGGTYTGVNCPRFDIQVGGSPLDQYSISACTTTDISGGLLQAQAQLANYGRMKSLWVVILLTDGEANATDLTSGQEGQPQLWLKHHTPLGLCPSNSLVQDDQRVYCQDGAVNSYNPSSPDADDAARDQADALGDHGLHAVIFTVGLGPEVQRLGVSGGAYGEQLLKYVAAAANNGNTENYFYSADGTHLQAVFEQIASRIFTRITQ